MAQPYSNYQAFIVREQPCEIDDEKGLQINGVCLNEAELSRRIESIRLFLQKNQERHNAEGQIPIYNLNVNREDDAFEELTSDEEKAILFQRLKSQPHAYICTKHNCTLTSETVEELMFEHLHLSDLDLHAIPMTIPQLDTKPEIQIEGLFLCNFQNWCTFKGDMYEEMKRHEQTHGSLQAKLYVLGMFETQFTGKHPREIVAEMLRNLKQRCIPIYVGQVGNDWIYFHEQADAGTAAEKFLKEYEGFEAWIIHEELMPGGINVDVKLPYGGGRKVKTLNESENSKRKESIVLERVHGNDPSLLNIKREDNSFATLVSPEEQRENETAGPLVWWEGSACQHTKYDLCNLHVDITKAKFERLNIDTTMSTSETQD